MDYNTMLPLLSDGLRDVLETVETKYNCPIAKALRQADALIELYNCNYYRGGRKEPVAYDHALDIIKSQIDNLINDEARMLSYRVNQFEISYLPKGKDPVYSSEGEKWARTNRQTAKPARIIQKLLNIKFSCAQFENFSNWIKAEFLTFGNFKLVEGKDITKYYNEDTYYKVTGMLGNSCMRYEDCEPYFKVYEDHAKMLICLKGDKITGRAIVWYIDGKYYMDRVYTCDDFLYNHFTAYAQENKWYMRNTQLILRDGESPLWLSPEDNYKKAIFIDLTIPMFEKYEYLPYMDSFRYYNRKDNTMSTNPDNGKLYLSSTDGYYLGKLYVCDSCGYEEEVADEDDDPEELEYSTFDDAWYCSDCRKWCDGLEDWVSTEHTLRKVYFDVGDYLHYPDEYIDENPSSFVKIGHSWYSIEYPALRKDSEGRYYLEEQTNE